MTSGKLMGAGVFTAIAASLCCITPVLAMLAGTGSIASSFSWIEPARPYLIGLTVAVLGFAWYQKLKPAPVDECGCATETKKNGFIHSRLFLLIITLFAGLMISFPSYAKFLFPKNKSTVSITEKSDLKTVEITIKGMTCAACEEEVNHEIYKLKGIVESSVSFRNRNAIVKFDASKTNLNDITGAINSTGYKVIHSQLKN